MKTTQELLTQITQLTSNIETNYPELYTFLQEEPITIPSKKHPEINLAVLQDYLETLKQELQHHIKTHKSK
ncbi:hypothetical protein KO494_09515 [Lacinutrix sp. C3R15]|uniref:hypothetical protein n=1 Tax=Flavobacteriaceae TaxID=49546 RepID=UPI001C0A604F|nr:MULTISPECIES: hypothetical protein [Flavobacteriaceae]MBU2939775.1 hypothetical protein [Lacinutrix sp. C3R15]MDO6623090.1 hypothetical protein [Oceanihabitans sp. 1_MG-2023]